MTGMTAEQIERRDFTYCLAIWHEPVRSESFVIGTPVLADAKPRALAYATERWGEPDQLDLTAASRIVQARKLYAEGRHDDGCYQSLAGRQPRKGHLWVTVHERVRFAVCRICGAGQLPTTGMERLPAHDECEHEVAAMVASDREGMLHAAGITAASATIAGLLAAADAVASGWRGVSRLGLERPERIALAASFELSEALREEAWSAYSSLAAAEEGDGREWHWATGRGKPGVGQVLHAVTWNPHGWRVTSKSRSWPAYAICNQIFKSGPPGCPKSEWRIVQERDHVILTHYWCEQHMPDDERPPAWAEVLTQDAS